MLYKTITLELIQEQYPDLHQRLKLSRRLLQELDRYATDLRASHLKWLAQGTEPETAQELALEELQERLVQETARLET